MICSVFLTLSFLVNLFPLQIAGHDERSNAWNPLEPKLSKSTCPLCIRLENRFTQQKHRLKSAIQKAGALLESKRGIKVVVSGSNITRAACGEGYIAITCRATHEQARITAYSTGPYCFGMSNGVRDYKMIAICVPSLGVGSEFSIRRSAPAAMPTLMVGESETIVDCWVFHRKPSLTRTIISASGEMCSLEAPCTSPYGNCRLYVLIKAV